MLLEEKRCKMAFMMCTYQWCPSLYKARSTPMTASPPPFGAVSSVVIHSLWITLWITMLITCKSGFYVLEL
jgi:hypothetical protein